MFSLKAINSVTNERVFLGYFDTMDEVNYNMTHCIEWDEGDIIEDWEFYIDELKDDINDDSCDWEFGFDPYAGSYTYDC